MGGAGGRGGPPLSLKNLREEPEDLTGAASTNSTPFTPCGVGADPKASPLPPAPLVTSGLLICRLKDWQE